MPQDPTNSIDELTSLIGDDFRPESLDQIHDTLRLIGVVLGQMTLLEIATSPAAEAAPRVAAARALMKLDEAPERIAERLRKSVFSRLSVAELGAMIDKVKKGETNLKDLIEQSK